MRAHRRPHVRPSTHWYLSVYTQSVKRLLGVLTVTYLVWLGILERHDPVGRGIGCGFGIDPVPADMTLVVPPFPANASVGGGLFHFFLDVLAGPIGTGVLLVGTVLVLVQLLSAR